MKAFTLYIRQLSLALLFVLFSVCAATAQTTTFTYQGKLPDEYNQPTALYDLQFNLYDEASGANSPLNATPIVLEDVQMTNGDFTVTLDFGNLFNGSNRYLEIGERPGNSTGAFTVLSPRQQIMSAPYTIRSLSAATADSANDAQNLNGASASTFVQTTDPRLTDPRAPIPGSELYVQNTTDLQFGANFNIGGTGTASVFDATTQFNIGGNRVLSVAGVQNIFAGNGAGVDTTGGYNSFVGTNAGYHNTTGFSNSFLGDLAGDANTTGSHNTMIGANADGSAGNLLFATAIGSFSTVGASDTIVLGKLAGIYDGVSRPADTVQIPGNLNVAGTISGNVNGVSLTNLNASNITSGTLADARLSSNVAMLSGAQTFTDTKTFAGGIIGNGSGLTNLNASNITSGTLDNARLGVIGVVNGGTGLTSAGANGNFLRSNGTGFMSSTLTAADVPDLSAGYVQNTTTQQANANFNVSGNGVVGGNLSVNGALNASGASLTNLNAANITSGTLDNARLGLIPTANIADGAITTPKIEDSAVTAAKIGSNQVVKNLNGLTDSVNLAAGANVTITPSGNTLTISAAGGNFIENTTTQQPSSNFNISGDGTAANLTANGTLSGNIVNATTQFNIGSNRVLGVAGVQNVFVGNRAGNSNTTGYVNSFVGDGAGYSNTSGIENSFFGMSAGYNNITGFANSFVGTSAGYNNTTGRVNSFFGRSAGYSNTTGNYNSFLGVAAGFYNTSGYNNSFMGTSAGYYNTTGYNNAAVGYGAGYLNAMGNSNSFVGVDAGYSTTGSSNSFVGTYAGFTNTTGGNNTIIGAFADVSANNLSYATVIGAEATVSTSNTIVLGRSAGQETVLIPGLLKLNTLGTAGGTALCRNASNQIAACSSSLRYKTNIAPFSFGLNLVRRLRPIRFEWKDGGMKDVGFGAEDVAAIEPLLITYNAKGEVEGVKYDRISTVLVNAVNEQQTQIEVQQAQLKQYQAQLEAQQQQLKQQQTLIEGLKKLLCHQNPKADVCRR